MANSFIQWKGTDVCLDFTCDCGARNHFDGYFAYHIQCWSCKQVYKLGDSIYVEKIDDPGFLSPLQSIIHE